MWLLYVLLDRAQNVAQRKRYVKLVDSVRECGGEVKIFSSMHISGERKYPYMISYMISYMIPCWYVVQ